MSGKGTYQQGKNWTASGGAFYNGHGSQVRARARTSRRWPRTGATAVREKRAAARHVYAWTRVCTCARGTPFRPTALELTRACESRSSALLPHPTRPPTCANSLRLCAQPRLQRRLRERPRQGDRQPVGLLQGGGGGPLRLQRRQEVKQENTLPWAPARARSREPDRARAQQHQPAIGGGGARQQRGHWHVRTGSLRKRQPDRGGAAAGVRYRVYRSNEVARGRPEVAHLALGAARWTFARFIPSRESAVPPAPRAARLCMNPLERT